MDSNPSMVLCICLEARGGIGILGQGTMWWEHCPPAQSRCILLRQNQWAFILPNSKSSQFFLLCIYKGLGFCRFTGSSLLTQKGVHLLGRKKKQKVKKEKSIKGNSQAKRGNQWDNLVVEAYPYLVICCKFESKDSSKRETCKFLSCIFKFASCVVSLL